MLCPLHASSLTISTVGNRFYIGNQYSYIFWIWFSKNHLRFFVCSDLCVYIHIHIYLYLYLLMYDLYVHIHAYSLYFSSSFSFGSIGHWIQGLAYAGQVFSTTDLYPQPFCFGFLKVGWGAGKVSQCLKCLPCKSVSTWVQMLKLT